MNSSLQHSAHPTSAVVRRAHQAASNQRVSAYQSACSAQAVCSAQSQQLKLGAGELRRPRQASHQVRCRYTPLAVRVVLLLVLMCYSGHYLCMQSARPGCTLGSLPPQFKM
ncbi:hypothetical protein NQZ68_001152 [Dissostichus eleginoides]|nr:hypothetical protein NQZ68_001152 [Dissostichus eleginoides]